MDSYIIRVKDPITGRWIGIPVMKGEKGDTGAPGQRGATGESGADGYSPTVSVTNITGGHRVTITDADDTHTFDVMDGQGGGGGGTSDHRLLTNRDADNQHPISAVTGLQSALDGKQPAGDYATSWQFDALADIVDEKADAADIPTKTSELTNDSGFLTEHQSLDGYATETYVNNHHDNTKQDTISDLTTIRSGAAKGATAVQPEAGKGLFSGNYNDLTNKPTIPTLDGYATETYVNNAITSAIGNIDNLVGSGVIV